MQTITTGTTATRRQATMANNQTTSTFHGLGIQNAGAINARDINIFGSNAVEQHGHVDKNKQRIQFLQQLRTDSPFEQRKNRNPPRADGTCEWFTAHERFQHWQQEHSALLWVSADPGCGKSVLSRYLIDDVFPPTATRTTCYFFFKDDFEDQKNLEGALRCILYQMFKQNPHLLLDNFLDDFEEEGDQLFATFRKLWDLLNTAARNHTHGEIICILDALDECQGHNPLAIALTQLYGKGKRSSPLKFLVTSRPYLRIRQDFQDLKASQPTIHLSGESQEESDKIAREIAIVIEQRTEKLCEKLEFDAAEKQILQVELATVKHRTYLWVHLVFASLEERTDIRFSKDHLRQAIRDLPHSVEEAYDKILRKSKDPDKARAILQIVVAADRPLLLAEMSTLLAFRRSYRTLKDLEKVLSPPDVLQPAIREACGLFLTIQDSRIFLLHQTAREFLVQLSPATRDPSLEWQYSLELQDSHRLIAEICMRYLLLPDFKTVYSDSTSSLEGHDHHDLTFRDYAACNWADHYRRAQDTISADAECLAEQLCDAKSPLSIHWLKVYADNQMKATKFHREFTTPLLIASYFGLENITKLTLRDNKKTLRGKSYWSGRTALSWASEKGYDLIVQSLLNEVPKFKVILRDWSQFPTIVNLADDYGRTPLWYAAANGHSTVVQELLKAGAKVGIRDEHGMTPLAWAAHHGHSDVVALLLESGARHDSIGSHLETKDRRGRTPLIKAARDGDLVVAQMLLDRGAGVDNTDKDGWTALMYACGNGHGDLAQLLLDRGAQVNAADKARGKPLSRAAWNGHPKLVQLLLDRGAELKATDHNGRSASHWASWEGQRDVVELLLDNGEQVDAADNDGDTVLMNACHKGHRDVVQLLLDRGAFIDAISRFGTTALFSASREGHKEVVQLLLERGARVNVDESDESRPALHAASENGHKEVVQLLLEHGARADCSWAAETALELASSNGHKDIEKLLLAYGARRR